MIGTADPFELILIGPKGAHTTLVDRAKLAPKSIWAHFGDKRACTHYDTPQPEILNEAGDVMVAEERVYCTSPRSKGGPNGFLCDAHNLSLYPKKPRHRMEFSIDATQLANRERRLIEKATIRRVRLITAGPNTKYLRLEA